MADIKFNWVSIGFEYIICKISDFELCVYGYYQRAKPCYYSVTLMITSSDDSLEGAATLFKKNNIETFEEAKQIIEAEFLRYWAKLKSEVENGLQKTQH